MNLENVKKILEKHPFVPPLLMENTHIQTILGQFVPYFMRKTARPERKLIKLPDHSQIAADCIWQKNSKQHATIVVLNGLEGYRGTGFSRFGDSMSRKTYYLGFNFISLKQRAEANTIPLTRSLFTSYSGLNDVRIAFDHFFRWGLKKLYLIGMSYGAYLALMSSSHLRNNSNNYVAGIVAIAPQVNMMESWKHIEKNKVYDFWLLNRYKNFVKRRATFDRPGTWDLKELDSIRTKEEFVTTYLPTFVPNNSLSIEEYNELINAEPLLPHIQIPTLIISNFDDPISPIKPYIKPAVKQNPNIITYLTEHGGHGAFVAGQPLYGDPDIHWAQNRALEFIKLLEKNL